MSGNPQTVLHGLPQSVPAFSDLKTKGHHATVCFLEDLLNASLFNPDDQDWNPFEYVAFAHDFATDGGALGDIDLGVDIPEDTVVWDGVYDVLDAYTSGGGCAIALKVNAANDILSQNNIAVSGTVGMHDVVPVGTAATAVRTTADRAVTLTVATTALTAGSMVGFLRCFRGFSLLVSSSSSSSSSTSSASSSSTSSASSSTSSASSVG